MGLGFLCPPLGEAPWCQPRAPRSPASGRVSARRGHQLWNSRNPREGGGYFLSGEEVTSSSVTPTECRFARRATHPSEDERRAGGRGACGAGPPVAAADPVPRHPARQPEKLRDCLVFLLHASPAKSFIPCKPVLRRQSAPYRTRLRGGRATEDQGWAKELRFPSKS